MCGIAGYITQRPETAPDILSPGIERLLAHRGPDDFGDWSEGPVRLLHWRLAILDLSAAGKQPMVSHDGRYVMVFNGEVYNHLEIRDALNQPGAQTWRGHSDTESILEAFSWWQDAIFPQLNGMFAMAIYDTQEKVLRLVRDRHGIKPLYYWQGPGLFAFASEAKFFSFLEPFQATVDPHGLESFFTYGHSAGNFRMLTGVRQVAPGELIQIRLPDEPATIALKQSRYVEVPRWRPSACSAAAAADRTRAVLSSAVKRQLVADVPVGVFLSGGVDSSILTALSAQVLGPKNTKAFTLGYKDCGADYNEIDEARAVASHLGVQHFVYEAGPSDLVGCLEQMVWHFDEPFGDAAALNMLVLSRLVRQHVTVALAGEGSDELFGGYRRYRLESWIRRFGPLVRVARTVAPLLRSARLPRRAAVLLRSLSAKTPGLRYSAYFENGTRLEDLLLPRWRSGEDPRSELGRLYPPKLAASAIASLCLADQQFWLVDTYLEKSDKSSMAHSLEVRVPFLDNEVADFANTLPDSFRVRGRQQKWILQQAFQDILPQRVFTRFKRGFGVPIAEWFKGDLADYFSQQVLSPSARSAEYIRTSTAEELLREHRKGAADRSLILWQTLVFEIWLRQMESGFERPDSEVEDCRHCQLS